MTTPRPNGPPRKDSPALITRFEWPELDPVTQVPGTEIVLRVTPRANGDAGISPIPAEGESEVARFVATWLTAVFPVGPDGHPLPEPSAAQTKLAPICSGGAEVLVTDQRMAIVLTKGSGALGRVDEERGVVVVADVPYRAVNSVVQVRKKRRFRSIENHTVRIITSNPLGAIQIEPLALIDRDLRNPKEVSHKVFADYVIGAACRSALTAQLMEQGERARLERVLHGHRDLDGLDIVGEVGR